uniref:Salivary lipocalin n=1 Tax=Ixodes ricinus TaxID=34613 RepID=V5ICX6_IXORI
MYPTLLVFASLVAAIISVGSEGTSSNDPPVDAWRTVTLTEAFYLMHRSFKTDAGLGGNGKCVSIQLSTKDDTTRTTKSRITYKNPETSQLIEKTVCVTVPRPDGSTVGDTIRMSNTESCEAQTTEVRFVYSDYGTCDVTVVLETDGSSSKCELWVKKGYQQHLEDDTGGVASRDDSSVKRSIAKCKEAYEKQCKGPKYQIYEKDTCGSLANESKETEN